MLKAENIVTYSQYLVSLLITWVLVIILVLRYFQIQVLSHDRYSQKANSNRIRKVTKTAPRGLILDRDGHILVDNLPTYVLTAIPGELIHKETQFGNISSIIGLDSSIVAKNYKKFYRGRFNATRLAKDLTFRQISKLEENRLNLDGVYYEQFPERYFPSDIKASHILGYVKEVDKGVQSNLKNKNEYVELAKQYNLYVRCFHITTSFENSFNRNKLRDDNKQVPLIAYNTYKKRFENVTVIKYEELLSLNFLKELFNIDSKQLELLQTNFNKMNFNKGYSSRAVKYTFSLEKFLNNIFNFRISKTITNETFVNVLKGTDEKSSKNKNFLTRMKNQIYREFKWRYFIQNRLDKILPYQKFHLNFEELSYIDIKKLENEYNNLPKMITYKNYNYHVTN